MSFFEERVITIIDSLIEQPDNYSVDKRNNLAFLHYKKYNIDITIGLSKIFIYYLDQPENDHDIMELFDYKYINLILEEYSR